MRKSFWSIFILSLIVLAVFLFYRIPDITSNSAEASFAEQKKQDLTASQKNFAPAKKLLLEKGVPFDPEILMNADWKDKISSSLPLLPELRTTLRTGDRIKGVQMADTLILPRDVELTGDTVILANTIIYEGTSTRIHGLGKNIYIYPVESTGNIAGTFSEAMQKQGLNAQNLPAVGERTDQTFIFDLVKEATVLEIDVSGQGWQDWLAQQKLREQHPDLVIETECPPQTQNCSAFEPASMGTQGTGGDQGANHEPLTLPPAPGGFCSGNGGFQDGKGGSDFDGEDGRTGNSPAMADAGKGGTGGKGGTINYTVPNNFPPNTGLVLRSDGGDGGIGGKGGTGGTGGTGQGGADGGDGANCGCLQGGSGNGGDGGKGGAGGRGGTGGVGGMGGDGGDGGPIFVFYPQTFNPNQVDERAQGGDPGPAGPRGDGGFGGVSGNAGDKGDKGGNSNCPSTQGHDGVIRGAFPTRGPGPLGQPGTVGTKHGDDGDYHPVPLPPPPTPGTCGGFADWGSYPSTGCTSGFIMNGDVCGRTQGFMNQCARFGGYEPESCSCSGGCEEGFNCSPIVVDVLGNGYSLTDAAGGVRFDLNNDGASELLAWTSKDSDDAWLTLDRNSDGFVDRGRELFGNVTPQPPPLAGEELNGFLALGQYDDAGFGGNGDGKISARDAVFNRLRLWQDANHNGLSEGREMKTLAEVGVKEIDLAYKQSRKVDEFGNQFRYRSKILDTQTTRGTHWAWDVFLVVQNK